MSGSLEVIAGPMFAGKTTLTIERVRTRFRKNCQRLVLIKHSWDTRYDKKGKSLITSHDGLTLDYPTLAVSKLANAEETIASIFSPELDGFLAIDEGQFFVGLVDFVAKIQQKYPKIDILVSGLNLDYRAEPFGEMPQIAEKATCQTILRAKCNSCGSLASYTHRKVAASDTILVGGAESYEPLCEACYRRENPEHGTIRV